MPLNERTVRTFHRTLYAGILQTVTLQKRKDDQKQGTVTSYRLHGVRQSLIDKTGETLEGEMIADQRCTFHIPRIELDRVGVHYLNPMDNFIDKKGRRWNPESPSLITEKLFEQHVCVDCLMLQGRQLHG